MEYQVIPVPENNNLPDGVRALGESDVRLIAKQNAELLGAVIDTAPSFDVTPGQVYKVLSRVLADQPQMLREIVWRGTRLDREVVDAMSYLELIAGAVEVISETREVHNEGRLETALVDVLRPYSAFLRGELA